MGPCFHPRFEPIYLSLLGGLFAEQRMPPGSILDAGAYKGQWACWYAQFDNRSRVVHALDPDAWLVNLIRENYGASHPNLRARHGALGRPHSAALSSHQARTSGMNRYPHAGPKGWYEAHRNGSYAFPTYTIDELFASETLAFAGLDLEGFELDALEGGRRTLLRDQPVVATEATVHYAPERTTALIAFFESLSYDSYLIEEVAGMRADVRNILHLPRSRAAAFADSYALDLAVASKVLHAVGSRDVLQYAFPCCAAGAACCPRGKSIGAQCCSQGRVHRWLNRIIRNGGEDVQRFTRTSWYDQEWNRWRPHRSYEVTRQKLNRRGDPSTDGGGFAGLWTIDPRVRQDEMSGRLGTALGAGWVTHRHTNCYDGAGAARPTERWDVVPYRSFPACLAACKARAACNGVTAHHRGSPCFLRATLTIKRCERDPFLGHFDTHVRARTVSNEHSQ